MKSVMKNTKIGVLLMLFCAVCLCSGQFIWKMFDGLLPVFIGFLLYGVGAVVMIIAYRFGELSVLQPVNSVCYIFSTILGVLFFHESISIMTVLGIIIIMAGIILLSGGERERA